jgi:SAM-dependent methyltransferase
VDPAGSIWRNPGLDERFQQPLEDFAEDHEASFDVAFAVFVLEHVADPAAFTRACARVLRPNGVLFGLTLNKYQYFGCVTWMTSRLGVTDRALALMHRAHGHGHHVPTVYRMNSPGQVSRHLDKAGFVSVDIRMFDKPEQYAWYLPRPLRPLPRVWSRAAYRLGNPYLMGHLGFRAVRGPRGPDRRQG